jgi:hypothetical protein
VIDGCIQLRNEYKLTADQVERIDVDIHPIVMELTAKKNPKTGLEGKFSVFYVAALAITAGKAGEGQFTDQAVAEPAVMALQQRVTASIDKSVREDQARINIRLKDGRVLERFIAHVIGSVENPISDAGLQEKFSDLCGGFCRPTECTGWPICAVRRRSWRTPAISDGRRRRNHRSRAAPPAGGAFMVSAGLTRRIKLARKSKRDFRTMGLCRMTCGTQTCFSFPSDWRCWSISCAANNGPRPLQGARPH